MRSGPDITGFRADIESLLHAAIEAAAPGAGLARRWPEELRGVSCDVVAGGKAAAAMLTGVVEHGLCRVGRSICVGPPGTAAGAGGLGLRTEGHDADHPLPTARNVAAAARVAEFVTETNLEGRPLVVLLSGGASAHLTLPVEGVTVEDCRAVTGALLKGGAAIEELNCVRKHLEMLKGGGLARLAAGRPVWTMILSDVVGDDVSSIASGPTAGDSTTFADAMGVLRKFGAENASPAAMRALEEGWAGRRAETVKPGDPVLAGVRHRIIGNNATAVEAVAHRACERGFHVAEVRLGVRGEASEAGRELARRAVGLRAAAGRACVIVWGGETTVTVRGEGVGGRNQEIALAAAIEIDGAGGVVAASFSTDGVDGPTEAAGAVATGRSVEEAAGKGVDGDECLQENDSFRFFGACGGLLITGPTGTNVNDVSVALVYPGAGA